MKNQIVAEDPFEKTGYRQILNLGHSMGHVFEACWTIPHGRAVALGLKFSLKWSRSRGLLSSKDEIEGLGLLERALGAYSKKALPKERVRDLLRMDKKGTFRNQMWFVFLKSPGCPVRQKVTVSEILDEAQVQGLLG